MSRHRMSRGMSNNLFQATASRTHPRNLPRRIARGGTRL